MLQGSLVSPQPSGDAPVSSRKRAHKADDNAVESILEHADSGEEESEA